MADKKNNRLRLAVEISMTALLLCLMAYQVTGEAFHEWLGISMTVVLIVHNILTGSGTHHFSRADIRLTVSSRP